MNESEAFNQLFDGLRAVAGILTGKATRLLMEYGGLVTTCVLIMTLSFWSVPYLLRALEGFVWVVRWANWWVKSSALVVPKGAVTLWGEIRYDESGPYVQAEFSGARIKVRTEHGFPLPPSLRKQEVERESLLPSSILIPVGDAGSTKTTHRGLVTFVRGAQDIGKAILVLHKGLRLLCLPSHVVSTILIHGPVFMEHNGRSVPFDPKDWITVVKSRPTNLDITILAPASTALLSVLGVKALTVAPLPQLGAQVRLLSKNEDHTNCMSYGVLKRVVDVSEIHHTASTLPGFSGSPILTHKGVVAMHVGHPTNTSVNQGVPLMWILDQVAAKTASPVSRETGFISDSRFSEEEREFMRKHGGKHLRFQIYDEMADLYSHGGGYSNPLYAELDAKYRALGEYADLDMDFEKYDGMGDGGHDNSWESKTSIERRSSESPVAESDPTPAAEEKSQITPFPSVSVENSERVLDSSSAREAGLVDTLSVMQSQIAELQGKISLVVPPTDFQKGGPRQTTQSDSVTSGESSSISSPKKLSTPKPLVVQLASSSSDAPPAPRVRRRGKKQISFVSPESSARSSPTMLIRQSLEPADSDRWLSIVRDMFAVLRQSTLSESDQLDLVGIVTLDDRYTRVFRGRRDWTVKSSLLHALIEWKRSCPTGSTNPPAPAVLCRSLRQPTGL